MNEYKDITIKADDDDGVLFMYPCRLPIEVDMEAMIRDAVIDAGGIILMEMEGED